MTDTEPEESNHPLPEQPPSPDDDMVERWTKTAQRYDEIAREMDDREWYSHARFEAYSYRRMARNRLDMR